MKDVAVSSSRHFRSFERFELMALASTDYATAGEPDFKGLTVSYIQALDFLKVI